MAESSGPSPTISGDSIKVIAETVGIANLKGEVAEALAADVEYRLRDLVQASSCGSGLLISCRPKLAFTGVGQPGGRAGV